jgi:phage terminase small subunit
MDFEPPIPLYIGARRTWDRLATRMHGEGRRPHVTHEMLAVFCQTMYLYEQCKQEVDAHGVLVVGRTERERVRNPALTPLNQARDALMKLARAVPLVDPKPDRDGTEFDEFLRTVMADDE